jgi:hypothetical protein
MKLDANPYIADALTLPLLVPADQAERAAWSLLSNKVMLIASRLSRVPLSFFDGTGSSR